MNTNEKDSVNKQPKVEVAICGNESNNLDRYIARKPLNIWPVGKIVRGWVYLKHYMYQRNIELDYCFHLGDGDCLYAKFDGDPYGLISSMRFHTDPVCALLLYEITGDNEIVIYQVELITKRMPRTARRWLGLPWKFKAL